MSKPCPGGAWKLGTGSPICPSCHRGWRSILGTRDEELRPNMGQLIPKHDGPQ